ncbi:MAG: phasin family protein [Nodosilinea sp. LVE1205-7]|jgi:polyhydroxyalkanoate synthesis regulator phasin
MDTSNLLQQLLMIGVGTTTLVAERLKQVTEEWVREGRFNPDQARHFVDEVMAQLNINNTNLEEQFNRLFRHTLQELGVPRQAEMDELRGRLDRLERQLRDLENRAWK